MTLTKEQKIGIGVGVGAAVAAVVALTRKAGAAPPVICDPGVEKCIGPDWCKCNPAGTKWDVLVPNDDARCPITPEKAILYGTVKDVSTMAVINGIVVDCGGYTDTTGSDGLYRISDIPPGTYSVEFQDPSGRYEPLTI